MKINPYMKGLGLRPDLPDIRDLTFEASIIKKDIDFPSIVDLRNHSDMPEIYDQKTLGSCTAQAVGALCDFEKGGGDAYAPSSLFLYYVTRSLEGTVNSDAGASIRNSIKAANEFGVAQESLWPYFIEKYHIPPSTESFNNALTHQALEYRRVKQRLNDIKECLYLENLVAIGIGVYEGLYKVDKNNPILPFPSINDVLIGGHALVICGYDEDKEYFIVRNSWGVDWGVDGYFYIPYEYIFNPMLTFDLWTISLVEK